ncbi:acyltransferase family protein [Photobacterium carnosum]|uniref:acyltransferase family protein n=1 Tax=Photobacterium carnosum TaxID=2023717 RepID=UPI001E34FFB9|nr:acyltransferase family protein [Photobacterium carnosum]MCD9545714.1 acyltransferase family protein [Photobacterium carnosum]
MKFRTDINGLRALAVIAVVLFHFNPLWVPGGFAGVDVFFVISGFLMTGLIFRGLENNNFSIINFYVARANRIIPALSVVCLVLLVFGWFYLRPLDYLALGKHVASSIGFLSNIIYWSESGYFDASSHSKWLLHTWSLSVEWQFYIIYPVVLVLLKKCMSFTNIKRLLVVSTVIGFIFSVYMTSRWPDMSYFSFPTRAWEMMMGGLAFLYPLQNLKDTSKKYLEWIGVTLILASYMLISKDNLWPGYLALIPVLGAYLVILANRSGSVITDNIVMQKVGLWSYSIYLWHWPVVVFGYYFEMQYWEWIGIPISVVLGFFSYKFIESIKFPALSSISFKSIATFKPLWMVVSLGLIGSILFVNITNKINAIPDINKYNMASKAEGFCFGSPGSGVSSVDYLTCQIGKKSNDPKILLFGDSFAGQYEPTLSILGKKNNIGILSITTNSCFPSFTKNFHYPKSHVGYSQCMLNRQFVEQNYKKYKLIFISGRWDEFFKDGHEYSNDTINMINKITSDGVKVVYLPSPTIIKGNITSDYISSIISGDFFTKEMINHRKDIIKNKYEQKIEMKLRLLSKTNDNFIYISKSELYKNDFFIQNGKLIPYSSEGGHISILGAEALANEILDMKKKCKIMQLLEQSTGR